jgi:two-component system, chemotaxis family, protein-glutamate methylesterase/glutaminase
MKEKVNHIVVIGASAGGLTILNELVAQFDKNWNAAFFIVLHLSRRGIGDFLQHRLKQHTELPCVLAEDGLQIEKGHIYIAVPNRHLIIKEREIRIGHGPEENRWRPSIDVMFRSASAAYKSQVTGIVLTGLLDDGASGMWAIKRTGGTTIVQDPNEAEYPDMPLSVLNKMDVDHCIPVSEMGKVLADTIANKQFVDLPVPMDIVNETEMAERVATGIDFNLQVGSQSVYTCPDCGGMLASIEDGKIVKYRCHTGHSYTEKDLLFSQGHNIETTLWIALRMMEERKNLLTRMEDQARTRGFYRFAVDHKKKIEELEYHIEKMKGLLFGIQEHDD